MADDEPPEDISRVREARSGMFRSLRTPNYRTWAIGALISNIGTWMQRAAQDWLVLRELTHDNATSVGVVMSLQFGPQVLLLPVTGYVADRFDRRKVLLATQSAMAALALGLGLLTVGHLVELWHVYAFAFALGCVTAFDAPARQAFVSELVGEADLANAVALNSTSFNAGRLVGPAVAGVLVAVTGSGWAFVLNAASFVAVIAALTRLRVDALERPKGSLGEKLRAHGGLLEGFRYIAGRRDLLVLLVMLGVVGTFGLNFPIFISTMAVTVFHQDASRFGLLVSTMAAGSVIGALLAAKRAKPSTTSLLVGAALFCAGCGLAAVAPTTWFFGAALTLTGIAAQTFTTTTSSAVQLGTEPQMRGRVMAILVAVALGTTPIGAPIVGWIADHFGPRFALAVGASSGLVAAAIGLLYLPRWSVNGPVPSPERS